MKRRGKKNKAEDILDLVTPSIETLEELATEVEEVSTEDTIFHKKEKVEEVEEVKEEPKAKRLVGHHPVTKEPIYR